MYYSNNLEYILTTSSIGNTYLTRYKISYLSKAIGYEHSPKQHDLLPLISYSNNLGSATYAKSERYHSILYSQAHSFTPKIFLSPLRPKARFTGDNSEIKGITEEIFELMMKEKLPSNISIKILPIEQFKEIHSTFGPCSNGILGFSINGKDKKIFVRENNLDVVMLVIGHEIGHVLTETLPNKHDEEAKAFAFSVEWAGTIKKHNAAGLGLNIKDEIDFEPARNGLHDAAFEFVNLMLKKGRKAIELHDDLVKKYVSIFNGNYC